MDHRFSLLLLCFLLSGFSALLYQTAWMREFAFVFGTSELALAAVLAGYMGGLAVGSAVASRIAPRIRRPVLAYGLLELGIALCAVGMPFGLRTLTAVYVAAFGSGAVAGEPGLLASSFRLVGAFALLLAPTALMGATLPLLARHAVRHDEEVGPRVGALYAINTAGAIAGTALAAFWLLPAIGLRMTVYVGALVNGLVFLAAAALARSAPAPPAATLASATPAITHGAWILPLMTASGAVSFAYEVFWVRLLSQLLGGSVYAFATMLSSFLLGIAAGSAVGGRLARRHETAAPWFALVQLWIAALGITAFALGNELPGWAKLLGAGWKASPVANAPVAAAVLLPVALCIGATFPLAVRILVRDAADTAAATARVYAWNTVGAIIGSIGTGFFLLPGTGFVGTAIACSGLSLAIAAVTGWLASPRLRWPAGAAAIGLVLLALLPLHNPWKLLLSFPIGGGAQLEKVRFFAVGRSATVMLTERPGAFRILTNGLPESLVDARDAVPGGVLLSRWLGLLPSLLRPDTRHMLVVGLGGANALEGIAPTVEQVDVVELEPEVLTANLMIGPERRVDPLSEERVRVIINDARGALMLSDSRYDAIVSQPSHPWTAGASHLYTREFFELADAHLDDQGVFVQWIGLNFVDELLLRSLVATLDAVFPHVQVYMPVSGGILFAASRSPLDPVAGVSRALREAPAHLARYGVRTPEEFLSTLLLTNEGIGVVGAGAPINTDDHNLLAAGSARIEENVLETLATRPLAPDHDPLPGLAGVDPVRITAALLRARQADRARTYIASLEGVARDVCLGWLAGWAGMPQQARSHFARAIAREHDSMGAHAGLLIYGLPPIDPSPEPVGVLRRIQETPDDPQGRNLARFEAQLAAIGRDHLLHHVASQLRARWRIASGDPQRAAEAVEILGEVMMQLDTLDIRLARIEAARIAGMYDVAWVGLVDFVRESRKRKPEPSTLRRARWLAARLPPDAVEKRVSAFVRRFLGMANAPPPSPAAASPEAPRT